MYPTRMVTPIGLILAVASMASAQETKVYSSQTEHQLLKRFEGGWNFEKLTVPSDNSKPEKLGSGEINGEMLGELFVVCRWTGVVYGADFAAVQTFGFDVEKNEYSGTWIDSIMNYRWQFHGPFDPKTNELTVVASGPDPNGATTQFRERYHFQSADSIKIVAEMLQDEKWVAFMTTELTRMHR